MQFTPTTRDHPVTIRSARSEDAPDVERLYRQLVPGDPAIRVLPGRIDQAAADPASLLLMAERAGRLAGSAFVTVCLDTMYGDRPYLVIENVVVEETVRGAGVGRRLLEAVDRVAVEVGASKVMLLIPRGTWCQPKRLNDSRIQSLLFDPIPMTASGAPRP